MTELEALETDLKNYQNDLGYQVTKNALDALKNDLTDLLANYEALYNEECKFVLYGAFM